MTGEELDSSESGLYSSEQLRANLGDEIYEIFVEEITEIHANLQEWIPGFKAQRTNRALLADIRRGYHTCKGSGRMAGALALGDYSWAHESMLNKAQEGSLPINDRMIDVLEQSVVYLGRRLPFFLTASKADAGVEGEVRKVEAFSANPDAVQDGELRGFDSLIQLELAADPGDMDDDEGMSDIGVGLLDDVDDEAESVADTATLKVDGGDLAWLSPEIDDILGIPPLSDASAAELTEPASKVIESESTVVAEKAIDVLDSSPELSELPESTDLAVDVFPRPTAFDLEPADPIDPIDPRVDAPSESAAFNLESVEPIELVIDVLPLELIPFELEQVESVVPAALVLPVKPAAPVVPVVASVMGVLPRLTTLEPTPFIPSRQINIDVPTSGVFTPEQIDAEADLTQPTDGVFAPDQVDAVVDSSSVPGVFAPDEVQDESDVQARPDSVLPPLVPIPTTVSIPSQEPPPSYSRSFDEQEENRIVWEMFREELPEQLQSLDSLMQVLQANPADREARQSLERELHTLKGGARMARLVDMGDTAHQAESILEQLGRSANVADVQSSLSTLQAHIDLINVMADRYAELDAPLPVEVAPGQSASGQASGGQQGNGFVPASLVQNEISHDSLLERLLAEQAGQLPDISVLAVPNRMSPQNTATVQDDMAALGGQEQIRLPAAFLDKMVERAGSLNVQQNGLAERMQVMADDVGEFGRTASRLKQLLRSLELETEAQIHAGYRQSAASKSKEGDFDPLEMDQYSEIQRLSRALAESLNDLVNIEADLAQQLRSSGMALKESLTTSRHLHNDLLETRLIEMMVIVPRLRRIVRQTSLELDRQVALEIEGEAFKLDRHLLQRMTAPLEHLLRNSVSHGIESVEERERVGKPAQGELLMKVFREDTEIVLQVQDDGRGLNRERLRKKAQDLGLIREDEALSDQEVLRLILHPGFSTATTVNQIAGRGVGMDVVSAEVKALGGALQIDSVEGQGTTFTVRLPFAMAVNPVLFVDVQTRIYALPMGYVQGLMRLDTDRVQKHLDQPDLPLSFNDENYTLHYLGAVLEPGSQLQMHADHMYPVVLVRTSGHCMAWVVDAISGRREVVLQSLGALFTDCRFYSAATITTDGQVVLLPDMADMAHRVKNVSPTEATVVEEQTLARTRHERPHILVVDDSITVRKVTEKLLVSQNHQVETAKDGLEALEKLEKFEPDLILMDIEMPRMDGFEVLSAVRQMPQWNNVPIIMISSRTAEKHRQRAQQLGANDFLGKPYQNQELLEVIRSYLSKSRQWAGVVA